LSMSTSTFLKLVEEGTMPKGIKVHGMTMWDRLELDVALENLKEQKGARRRNPIEEHYGIADSD
jgi:predicted DNA-binding transcriptional regulator AlpA